MISLRYISPTQTNPNTGGTVNAQGSRYDLLTTDGATTPVSGPTNANTTPVMVMAFYSNSTPEVGGITITTTVTVSAIANDPAFYWRVCRYNSSGVLQLASAYSPTYTTTGTRTIELTLDTTWFTGNQIVLEIWGHRNAGHSTPNITVASGVNSYIQYPRLTYTRLGRAILSGKGYVSANLTAITGVRMAQADLKATSSMFAFFEKTLWWTNWLHYLDGPTAPSMAWHPRQSGGTMQYVVVDPGWHWVVNGGTLTPEQSDRSLRNANYSAGANRLAINPLWLTEPHTDVDIVARFRGYYTVWDNDLALSFSILLRGRANGTTQFDQGYLVGVADQTGHQVRILKQTGLSSATRVASVSKNVYNATGNNMRGQIIGNTIRVKVWGATANEPVAWDLEYTDTTSPYVSGTVMGPGSWMPGWAQHTTFVISFIGIGINGDAYPTRLATNYALAQSAPQVQTGLDGYGPYTDANDFEDYQYIDSSKQLTDYAQAALLLDSITLIGPLAFDPTGKYLAQLVAVKKPGLAFLVFLWKRARDGFVLKQVLNVPSPPGFDSFDFYMSWNSFEAIETTVKASIPCTTWTQDGMLIMSLRAQVNESFTWCFRLKHGELRPIEDAFPEGWPSLGAFDVNQAEDRMICANGGEILELERRWETLDGERRLGDVWYRVSPEATHSEKSIYANGQIAWVSDDLVLFTRAQYAPPSYQDYGTADSFPASLTVAKRASDGVWRPHTYFPLPVTETGMLGRVGAQPSTRFIAQNGHLVTVNASTGVITKEMQLFYSNAFGNGKYSSTPDGVWLIGSEYLYLTSEVGRRAYKRSGSTYWREQSPDLDNKRRVGLGTLAGGVLGSYEPGWMATPAVNSELVVFPLAVKSNNPARTGVVHLDSYHGGIRHNLQVYSFKGLPVSPGLSLHSLYVGARLRCNAQVFQPKARLVVSCTVRAKPMISGTILYLGQIDTGLIQGHFTETSGSGTPQLTDTSARSIDINPGGDMILFEDGLQTQRMDTTSFDSFGFRVYKRPAISVGRLDKDNRLTFMHRRIVRASTWESIDASIIRDRYLIFRGPSAPTGLVSPYNSRNLMVLDLFEENPVPRYLDLEQGNYRVLSSTPGRSFVPHPSKNIVAATFTPAYSAPPVIQAGIMIFDTTNFPESADHFTTLSHPHVATESSMNNPLGMLWSPDGQYLAGNYGAVSITDTMNRDSRIAIWKYDGDRAFQLVYSDDNADNTGLAPASLDRNIAWSPNSARVAMQYRTSAPLPVGITGHIRILERQEDGTFAYNDTAFPHDLVTDDPFVMKNNINLWATRMRTVWSMVFVDDETLLVTNPWGTQQKTYKLSEGVFSLNPRAAWGQDAGLLGFNLDYQGGRRFLSVGFSTSGSNITIFERPQGHGNPVLKFAYANLGSLSGLSAKASIVRWAEASVSVNANLVTSGGFLFSGSSVLDVKSDSVSFGSFTTDVFLPPLVPASDVGSENVIPNSGSSLWDKVDEGAEVSDDDVSYIQLGAIGEGVASFTLTPPPADLGSVRSLHLRVRARLTLTSIALASGGKLLKSGEETGIPLVKQP